MFQNESGQHEGLWLLVMCVLLCWQYWTKAKQQRASTAF